MRCITLTTDFGHHDWFVGTMKGVILAISPGTAIVDLTHGIPPGDLQSAAFSLAASYSFFPRGTIHVAVIDPGVGSARRSIAIRTSRYTFVGPDNGIFSRVLAKEKITAIHVLENQKWFNSEVSATFHGRDVFAPVAAHLSRGIPIRQLGPATKQCVRLSWPEAQRTGRVIRGAIQYLDRFGNALTNISAADLRGFAGQSAVYRNGEKLAPVAGFYQAVPSGKPVAVVGSTGFLELAVNRGRAADVLGLRVGSRLEVRAIGTLRGPGRPR